MVNIIKTGTNKVKKKAFNIEEIFVSVSNVKNADLNVPPARITLTPRSAESCLKHGVNPKMLEIRDLESFSEGGLDPVIQRMRHEAYSQRRHEMMRLVRGERKRIMNLELKLLEEAQGMGEVAEPSAAQRLLKEQEEQNIAAIEQEKKRLEKIKEKQQKEIEQVVEFETKMAEIQTEIARRQELDRKKQEAMKRARDKRMRQLAEERRLKELRKKAQEDAEEEQRVRIAREMFKKDIELKHQREIELKKQKIEAQLKEEERNRKNEEHRLATLRIVQSQQKEVEERLKSLQVAEKKRVEKVKKQQKEARKKIIARRKAIEIRLQENLEKAKDFEEKRKELYYLKVAHHEKLKQESAAEREAIRRAKIRETELLEKKRLLVLQQSHEEEELRKQIMLNKFEQDEEHVKQLQLARDREQRLINERKNLKLRLKAENVERVRRVNEFKRLQTKKKMNDNLQRMETLAKAKQDILEQRRKNAVQTKRAKDSLVKIVEKAKSCSGDKQIKLLKMAVNGMTDDDNSKGKKKNSKKNVSAGNQRDDQYSSLPDINQCNSAPVDLLSSDVPPAPHKVVTRDAPPKAEAYVSPYEKPVKAV